MPVICLAGVAALAVLLRCFHLLKPGHHYILSMDSHFFYWQAARVLEGESVGVSWHSGLTYPLAFAARGIASISGMEPVDALDLACKTVPPLLGIASVVVVYLLASRMYNWRAGLGAAFAWATMSYPLYVQTAGFVDRDGLSMLLVTAGVGVFYLSTKWHVRVAGVDVGWLVGAVIVMAVEAVVFIEWQLLGAVYLAVVLVAGVGVEVIVNAVAHLLKSRALERSLSGAVKESLIGTVGALRRSAWRPLALILGVSLVVAAVYPGFSYAYRMARDVVSQSGIAASDIAELRPLSVGDILAYGFLLMPLAVGMYLALTRHRREDCLLLGWFVVLFALGIPANRIFMYAAPAGCMLCGLGLATMLSPKVLGKVAGYIAKVTGMVAAPPTRFVSISAAVVLSLLLVVPPVVAAYRFGDGQKVAAHEQWQDALAFLREETPEDTVVMSWWDYGYWILNLGDRRPVVDNGYYGWTDAKLKAVGLAYCTPDPAEAARVMREYGADYLIFSRLEVEILPVITEYGIGAAYGDTVSVPEEMRPSFYYQSLYGDFREGGGLRRVYPSLEAGSPEVVILQAG